MDLEKKIEESINTVKVNFQKLKHCKGRVKIYNQPFPYSYSLFRFDNTVVVIPYRHTPGRSTEVPAFVFSKGEAKNLFDYYVADFEQLLSDSFSKIVYENE